MKKYFLLLLLSISCSLLCEARTTPSVAVVTGEWNKNFSLKGTSKELILYKVSEGNKVAYGKVVDMTNEHPEFAFAVPLTSEGLYYISDPTGWWYVRIYLKPGDQLNLEIDEDGNYKVLKGSMENKLLHQWFELASSITIPVYRSNTDTNSYRSYFEKYDKVLRQSVAFKKQIVGPNKKFNELLKLIVDTDPEAAALLFYMTPRQAHTKPDSNTVNAFYRPFFKPGKYCNPKILQLGEAVQMLGCYATLNNLFSKKRGTLSENTALFCNDTVKGAYITSQLRFYKFYDDLVKDVEPIEQYLLTDLQKKAYTDKLKMTDTVLVTGKPGFNFSLPDVNEKKVSMKDLKGKVVVMDVWATWCAPCRAQFPHLKKLEEEFKDADIAFVSVSTDDSASIDKWKAMIVKESLGGIQLIASGKNDFINYYKVESIPRFMVFDKEGKIVNVDAPRPSEKELKKLLEFLLQKKTS
jgi:thiol-disulfide isomerase/thioredoxin